jgi:drug/metabolite transporter (DMT)-like permease
VTGQPRPRWHGHARKLLIGSLFAVLAAMLYGGNVPAARAASLAGAKGADIIFYRAILLAVLAMIIARLMGVRLVLLPEERRPMLVVAVGASLTALFYLTSIDHLPVPMAVVILYTFPLMVMLATPFVERRPLSLKLVVLFLIAFAGLVMAIGPSLSQINPLGAVFAFLAALTNTVLYFNARRASAAPLRTMFYTQCAAMPLGLVFVVAQHGALAPLSTFWAAPWAIIAVIAGYAFGFIAQMSAAQTISPARMGLLFLAEPATSILIAALVLGEVLSLHQMLGVAMMLSVLAGEILFDRD